MEFKIDFSLYFLFLANFRQLFYNFWSSCPFHLCRFSQILGFFTISGLRVPFIYVDFHRFCTFFSICCTLHCLGISRGGSFDSNLTVWEEYNTLFFNTIYHNRNFWISYIHIYIHMYIYIQGIGIWGFHKREVPISDFRFPISGLEDGGVELNRRGGSAQSRHGFTSEARLCFGERKKEQQFAALLVLVNLQ